MDQRIEYGIWGGTAERELRALLRRRSTVSSWRVLLETARHEHRFQGGLATGRRAV